MAAAVLECLRAHADVFRVAAHQLDCTRQRLAPRQFLDDVRISGGRQFAGVPLTGDEQCVGTHPRHVLLALRQHEAALREAVCTDVELAHGHRILAAVGEQEQAALFGRAYTICAVPHPVGLLRLREGVEVEHGGPHGRLRAVTLEGCLAPDAANVRRILPEVEQRAGHELDVRYAVACLCHGERGLVELAETRILLEHFRGLVVLGFDPRHRAIAGEIFQPAEVIGGVWATCLSLAGASGCREQDESEEESAHGSVFGVWSRATPKRATGGISAQGVRVNGTAACLLSKHL